MVDVNWANARNYMKPERERRWQKTKADRRNGRLEERSEICIISQ